MGCRLERSRQWAVRCTHEAQMHDANSFLTLTYSPENYPPGHSISIRTWQLFAKKLRKKCGPFRFYMCGEYGDKTERPHYHALIFGLDFFKDRKPYKKSRGHQLYTSDLLDSVWSLGACYIGEVTYESAAYVARYIMKKQTGKDSRDFYQRTDKLTGEVFTLAPPFTSMSRMPGIGEPWLKKYQTDVYPSDEVIINGKKVRPPKYYDRILEVSDPAALKILKRRREAAGKKHADNNTPQRLADREEIHAHKAKAHNENRVPELPEQEEYHHLRPRKLPDNFGSPTKPEDHEQQWTKKKSWTT